MISQGMQIRKQLRLDIAQRNQKATVRKAVLLILAEVALGVLVAAASFIAFATTPWLSVPGYFIASFFIGTRFRALSNLMHECSHYALTSDRRWNNILGKLLSIPLLTSFDRFRATHFSHHQHTGDSKLDLDFLGYEQFRFEEPLTRAAIRRHLWTTLTLRHVPSFVGKTFYVKTDPLPYNVLRLGYVGAIVAIIAMTGPFSTATLALVGYLVIPYAVTFQTINYWTDVIDHAGLFDNDDELHQTRNAVVRNPIVRAILFPRQDCFHLVHHLFPQLPVAFLPVVHSKMMGIEAYAALDHTFAGRLLSEPQSPNS